MKSAVRSIRFFKNNAAKSRPSQGSDTMYVPGLNFKCFSFDVMSQSVFNSSLSHFKVTISSRLLSLFQSHVYPNAASTSP